MNRRAMLRSSLGGLAAGLGGLLGFRIKESAAPTGQRWTGTVIANEPTTRYIPYLEYKTNKVRVAESQDGVTWTIKDTGSM